MAEILTLRDVYKKEGLQFIHKLLDNHVIISEKLNATRFSFEKMKDGKFEFFKKDGKITAIERTLNQLYEAPIKYITELPKTVVDAIPVGYRYGFRFFHSTTPINVIYDRVPTNNLVLTDIRNSLTEKLVDDIKILNDIADLLIVDKPPIIWNGKLDDAQKTRIMEYIRTPEEHLIRRFKTDSFTRYIISILNPSIKKTSLNNDIEKPIDSIIFKFIGEDQNETFFAKAIDPIIQQVNKTNEVEREPQDMYGIILSDIVEFVKINGISSYKLTSIESDEKFIELICLLYNDYIKKNGYKFDGVELSSLSFTTIPQFDLNSGFIPNFKTRELILSSTIFKDIFKIMVSALSKPRRKPFGTMTQMLVDDIKEIAKRIKDKIGTIDDVKESSIPTFEEYLQKKKENSWTIRD